MADGLRPQGDRTDSTNLLCAGPRIFPRKPEQFETAREFLPGPVLPPIGAAKLAAAALMVKSKPSRVPAPVEAVAAVAAVAAKDTASVAGVE